MRLRIMCLAAATALLLFGHAGAAFADPEDPNLGVSCEYISDTGLAQSVAHSGSCDVPPDPGGDH
jgi:hypothetical protein